MIVVSDTTPLRHLIAIDEVDLLHKLFGTVVVPTAVLLELRAERTPPIVKQWLDSVPAWLEVRTSAVPPSARGEEILDAGELAAIGLATELHADLLLIDDREARLFALRLGLPVTGTLGVLEQADEENLLPDLRATLKALESSGFYLSVHLREAMLERHHVRHSAR